MTDKRIEPKPTTYRGRHCKSRLEARWAVFLDYHFAVDVWEYEPMTFRNPETGWDYTPDFIVKVGPYSMFLEIKPVLPTETYIEELLTILPYLPLPLMLAVGDFYEDVPQLASINEVFEAVLNGDKTHIECVPLNQTLWFPAPDEAIRSAKTFRFDLPHGRPPHRKGTFQSVQAFMEQWGNKDWTRTAMQQAGQRETKKKKPIRKRRTTKRKKKP